MTPEKRIHAQRERARTLGTDPAHRFALPAFGRTRRIGAPTPSRLLLLGWAGWLGVYILSGLRYGYRIDPAAWGWLAAGSASVVFGAWVVAWHYARSPRPLPTGQRRPVNARRVIKLTFALSMISVAFRVLSGGFVLPTFSSAAAIATSRVESMADTAVRISDVGTPLSTFGVVAAITIAYVPRRQLGNAHFALGLLAATQYVLMAVAAGSRTPIAYVMAALALGYLCRTSRRPVRLRALLAVIAASALLILLSFWLLDGRLQAQGFSSVSGLSYLSQAHSVILPTWATSNAGPTTYTLMSLAHYMAHGTFEYGYLYTWRDETSAPLGLGLNTLAPIPSMLEGLLGYSMPSWNELSPRVGVYQGLFGAFLIDFGKGGMVLAGLLIGVVGGRLHQRVLAQPGDLSPVLLYVPVAVAILAAPFFNAVGGAYGVYIMIASVVTVLTTRRVIRA